MDKSSVRVLILIVLAVIACVIIYKVIKYRIKNKTETITAYTGGLGSGKTLFSVHKSLAIYGKQVRKWKRKRKWFYIGKALHLKRGEFNLEKPLFFSNIPVKMGKDRYSYMLKKEHLLLQERIPKGSVILLDEIGAFASQFDFKEKNVIEVFDEFVRFYRHYTQGGYIVCNDQCSENINLVIRRRLNIVHNLANCFVLGPFCFYYERMISISEEIKTIDMRSNETDKENDTQNNMVFHFRILWHKKSYDTYCYSERYNTVPESDYIAFSGLKTLKLLKCPKDRVNRYEPKTSNDEKKGEEK